MSVSVCMLNETVGWGKTGSGIERGERVEVAEWERVEGERGRRTGRGDSEIHI